jgi:hypothetical protein
MTKKTKMILGVAVAVGVGYWLYKKYGKKSTSSNFAGFVGGDSAFWNAGGLSNIFETKSTMATTSTSMPSNYSTNFNVEGCKKFNPNCKCYDRECSKCSCPQTREPFYYLVPNPQVHP